MVQVVPRLAEVLQNIETFWMEKCSVMLDQLLWSLKAYKSVNLDDYSPHLNRDTIECNLIVPGIQGCHENALCKNFETSPPLYMSVR